MSTHKHFDLICVAVLVCALLITVLFMNGESLGIQKIVDEDAESYTGALYFTANDLNGDWDSQSATQIVLNGDSAKISGQGAYVYDGDVYISGGGYYAVSGTLENGSIVVDAYSSSKVWLLLNGVEMTCEDDACIKVEQADKVFLTLAAGSENVLHSGAVYSDTALAEGTDGVIFARDDLTINGSGSLTVQAEYAHGIAANDDLVITGGTIVVTAAKDGINANDSLRIKDADITVTAEDDGLVVSKETADEAIEDGYLYVESGRIAVTSADDGIHTIGDVTIVGGEITIAAGDDGIHSDTAITVSDGTILISECYEGLEAVAIDVLGGTITIYPTDDGFNANGGSGDMFGMGGPGMGGFDMGGSGMGGSGMGGSGMGRPGENGSDTDNSDTTEESSGTDSFGVGGRSAERNGMPQGSREQGSSEAAETTQAGDGTQDSSNASQTDMTGERPEMPGDFGNGTGSTDSEEETYINISGGTITIINETAQDADGLDSNGDIYISGGTIRISLVNTGSNSALDYGSENGGVCEISGGNIIACGSSSMAESFDSTSTQCSILYNISQGIEASTRLALENADGTVLLEYEVPCSFSSAVISCPEMVLGESYLVVIGDDVEEVALDETSASFGDAQSSMFGGSMNWGGMQDRSDFGGMQGGHGGMRGGRGGRQSENTDSENTGSNTESNAESDGTQTGTGAEGSGEFWGTPPDFPGGFMGDVSGDLSGMPDMSDMQRPDGDSSDGGFGGSMGENAMEGGFMGGNFMEQGSGDPATETTDETATGSGTALTEYGRDTWVLLGASVLVLAAGIVAARLYRRN